MAEILSVERLIQRTMNGNNPHLPSKVNHLEIDEELDEIPELTSQSNRKSKRRRPIVDQDDDEPEIQDNTDDESPVLHVDLSDLDQ
ncbi:hypothetical protein LSH36_230g05037, partial [Paralvinella palmiformis]